MWANSCWTGSCFFILRLVIKIVILVQFTWICIVNTAPTNLTMKSKSIKEKRWINPGNQTNDSAITQGQSIGEKPLLQLLRRQLPASGWRWDSRLCTDKFIQQYHVQLLCKVCHAQWRTAWGRNNAAAKLQIVRVLRSGVCSYIESAEILFKLCRGAKATKKGRAKTTEKSYATATFRCIKSA